MFGYNQISYHSFYYSTRGGWWDWAPGGPCYRQPYWPLLGDYFTETRRLCFLALARKTPLRRGGDVSHGNGAGRHDRYQPGAGRPPTAQALSVGLTEELFRRHGLDFDFIDDQSAGPGRDGRRPFASRRRRVSRIDPPRRGGPAARRDRKDRRVLSGRRRGPGRE